MPALPTWLATLAFTAWFTACTPPTPGPAPGSAISTGNVAPPKERREEPARDALAHDAPEQDGAPHVVETSTLPSESTPSPEEVQAYLARQEAARRCSRKRCGDLGKACFDNCYRHGHPRDPAGHTRCDESCRRSYRVDECEEACERSAGALADAGPAPRR